MNKMVFLAGLAALLFVTSCDHVPPGWNPPENNTVGDEPGNDLAPNPPVTDQPGNGVFTPDAGVDAPRDTPDAEYAPDSGTDTIELPDAESPPDACVCPCGDDDDGDAKRPQSHAERGGEDGGHCEHHGHGHGHGHYKLHCHHGGHCHESPCGGNWCHRGYHCHVGHDCNSRGHHPECEDDTGPVADLYDSCGNPCECPGDNDLEDGDDENFDADDEENED